MEGWISLHRKLLESDLWKCETFTRGQAWVDLLLLANHADSFFYKRGVKIDVKRGQVGRSEVELSDRWKWSRSKVRKFIKDLEKEQQIEQQKTNITQILTIINYNEYQNKEQQTEQQKDTKRTAEEQQKDTYNNVNKENNENNVDNKEGGKSTAKSKSFSPDIYSIYDSVINHFPEDLRPNTEKSKIKWLDEIRKMIEIDGETKEAIIYVVEKIRADVFWNKNFLSLLKLRKKDGNEVTYMNVFKAHIKSNRNKTGAIQGIKVESQKHYEEWK